MRRVSAADDAGTLAEQVARVVGRPRSDDLGSGSATAAVAQDAGPSLRRYAG